MCISSTYYGTLIKTIVHTIPVPIAPMAARLLLLELTTQTTTITQNTTKAGITIPRINGSLLLFFLLPLLPDEEGLSLLAIVLQDSPEAHRLGLPEFLYPKKEKEKNENKTKIK